MVSPAQTTDLAVVLEAVADGRVHRLVLGRRGEDPDAAGLVGDAVGHLGHLDVGRPGQVVVVGDAVADVLVKHRQRLVDEGLGPGRADHLQRRRARSDSIQNVVTTSLKSVMWSECRWVRKTAVSWPMPAPGGHEPHQHPPAAVDQQLLAAGLDQRGRARPERIRQRVPRPQRRHLHAASLPHRQSFGTGQCHFFGGRSTGPRDGARNQPMAKVEAVLWDVGGVFLPSPFTKIRAAGDEMGIGGDRLLELVFGPYHEDTDHPWHRLERGELSFEDCNTELIAAAAADGYEVDPIAVLMSMGGDGMRIVRDEVVGRGDRGQGQRPQDGDHHQQHQGVLRRLAGRCSTTSTRWST